MKNLLTFFLLLAASITNAQLYSRNFSSIDWRTQSIDADTPDSLVSLLITPYQTDIEKTRAIFSWIAQHISYNTGIYNAGRKYTRTVNNDTWDTMSVWKSGEEMTARKVMRRRIAVCDGYAKLFKTLCDYAGLQSVVITGYAKCRLERNEKFRTNHSWNAVMIDSSWYLLDVTWASGHINFANEFVPYMEEKYFLTPPRQFIMDHYPEDQRWTLLEKTPVMAEFRYTPFRCKSFIKYGIHSVIPSNGQIEAAIGDTVNIELHVRDAEKNKLISSDPFFDSTMTEGLPTSVFLKPTGGSTRILYRYVVSSDATEWLNILYNDDMVLRYKLDIKKDKFSGK